MGGGHNYTFISEKVGDTCPRMLCKTAKTPRSDVCNQNLGGRKLENDSEGVEGGLHPTDFTAKRDIVLHATVNIPVNIFKLFENLFFTAHSVHGRGTTNSSTAKLTER